MGTAVLRSPAFLARNQTLIFPQQGRSPNRSRSGGRRKRSPSDSESERSMVVKAAPAKELVMGEVRILKRGEDVTVTVKKVEIEVKSREESAQVTRSIRSTRSTRSEKKLRDVSDVLVKGRLGPEPESIPKGIRLKEVKNVVDEEAEEEKFAGSAFVASPSPSDLPYPGFFAKKVVVTTEVAKEATKDLCRLLRLDLL